MAEGLADPAQNSAQKGKRLQGACDACKKKKVRCDSAVMPGNRCTNCTTSKTGCTHARFKAEENTPKTAQEYIEDILSASTAYIPLTDPYEVLVQVARYARSLEAKLAALQPQTPVPKSMSLRPMDDSSSPVALVDDDDHLHPLSGPIPTADAKPDLFGGKSRSLHFIKSAIKHIHGSTSVAVGVQRPGFWNPLPVSQKSNPLLPANRNCQWEKLVIETPQHVFPEDDLLNSLLKIYFEQINPILGILHSPSFYQSVAEGLHFRNPSFGAVVLAVCALASRSSDDPRVILDGVHSEHSCGWKWFQQVRPLRASFSPEPSLHQLQLSIHFLAGTSHGQECWILAGLGVHCAQGAGAHHRGGYSRMDRLKAELHKRVFYALVAIDTLISFKGKMCMINSVDFDLDFPVDCDEEYWETPNAVQPRGKPSMSAFVIAYLSLIMIFGRIQRAVLPSPDTIVELDSELNEWVDALPPHLRWDPNQENQVFLQQSAALYASYYHAQILIHRPFIPVPGKKLMSNVQTRRSCGLLLHPQITTILFDSAVVLLINVWAVVGKSRTTERYNRATADVQNCVHVLRLYERRWRIAGRQCDIISAMLNIGRYTSDGPSLKRPRDLEEEATTSPDVSEFSHDSPENRPIAGTSRAMSVAQQLAALELSIQETDHLSSLPLHTDELGRLPVYDLFDYEFTFQPDSIQFRPDEAFGLVEPEFPYEIDPSLSAPGSSFYTPPNGGLPGGDEIPSGHGLGCIGGAWVQDVAAPQQGSIFKALAVPNDVFVGSRTQDAEALAIIGRLMEERGRTFAENQSQRQCSSNSTLLWSSFLSDGERNMHYE
ncbi:fungal-specific transcription factor domain-containing protein [Mycena latifolia]|nr:fungal-specific transcription factor domain-containing protein [Mycena latifolia]